MGIGINDFRIAIRIDNAEAKQKLVETKDVISVLRNELSKMETDGKKDTAVYIEKKAALDKLNNEYKEHKKVVGLTGLTYDELRKGARTLKVQMDRSIPNSEKWLSYQRDLNLVEERLKILRGQIDSTEMSLSKFPSGFNKYAAIGASVIASLTGITLTARKCVDEFAQMQEAESQVRKYTGMTSEQVADLNEEFKKMDTRTARERLNELAGDAGRLGITAKNDVLEFVEAANMIDVALGEDLGQDAIKNIGKLADMFGDSERSMKENMLAIGSAVNEVAQNSSAAEPYLVEFSARMGGVAKQAKLSITDVMGFASALDQNMLRSEMASTALQGLILKLYQEPAKYAKIARMDVKQFTTLMETDANEAVLQFLASLGKIGRAHV